ncbi:MAG: glutathione S-transferase family protein [Holosporales bacterium]
MADVSQQQEQQPANIKPRQLYTIWLSPFARKIIVQMEEKKLPYTLVQERIWERRPAFMAMNPAGQVPVLVEPDGQVICHSSSIAEYLEETEAAVSLLGNTPYQRAETRRLVAWFDQKFQLEVTRNLLDEKIFKRLMRQAEPNSATLRAGLQNIHYHLDYIGYLTEQRNWLAGETFSLADITAAAHLSSLDYLGDVPWADHMAAKTWYARVKSRPSFRPILAERMPSLPPSAHYLNLDF